MSSESIVSVAAGTLGVPVVVSAVALAGYLTWLRPREARRSLRAVGDAVRRQFELDVARGTLPPADADVRAFTAALSAVLDDPDHWRQAVPAAEPGGAHLLDPGPRQRLDRYVRTVERELRHYQACARWTGVRVTADVAGLLSPAPVAKPQPVDVGAGAGHEGGAVGAGSDVGLGLDLDTDVDADVDAVEADFDADVDFDAGVDVALGSALPRQHQRVGR